MGAASHPEVLVHHNTSASRFEASVGGRRLGILSYERRRSRIELIHTVTDPEHRGRGIASALVRAALADVRAQGRRAIIICPFVESWLLRHPEYQDVVIDD